MTRSELALLLGAPAGLVAEPRRDAVVIEDADARRFMTALAAATAQGGTVMLAGSDWGQNERRQLAALQEAVAVTPATAAGKGWLCIPTGGSGGQLKLARHDEETLAAAVRGFCQHFKITQVNAVGVLPLHHVSGLMAWLRCALTGGEYRPLDWKAVEAGELPALPVKPQGWMISLVPTQLERLLRSDDCRAGSPASGGGPVFQPAVVGRRGSETPPYMGTAADWLRQFRIIFLGGAPAWPELLAQAAAQQLPLSLGYGMTETAAMVTALRPEEFLLGARSNGPALPHATVKVGPDGVIAVGGDSLFRGYHPQWRDRRDFATGDLGRLDAAGHLHVIGRSDGVIITGGEKVDPAEVEAVLVGSGELGAVAVLGLPDAEWGQVVVAAYPATAQPVWALVHQAVASRLAAHKRPKHYVPVADWPVNAAGKVNRTRVAELARAELRVKG